MGLGAYVPALLIAKALRHTGTDARVCVFESLLTAEQREQIDKTHRAYHERFDLALMGQRLAKAGSLRPQSNEPAVAALLGDWNAAFREHFIVLSGFWVPILTRYTRRIQVDYCQLDAQEPPSWRGVAIEPDCRCIRLFDGLAGRVAYQIPRDPDGPPEVDYECRPRRIVVHGGGWGLGEYRKAAFECASSGWSVDLIVEDASEITTGATDTRFFMTSSSWRPWNHGHDGPTFPPLAELQVGQPQTHRQGSDRHELADLLCNARAVVSKPGGGTLIDSFSHCVPLVWLAPYGEHEAANAALWQQLGFGISMQTWRESGCSASLLALAEARLRRARAMTAFFPGVEE